MNLFVIIQRPQLLLPVGRLLVVALQVWRCMLAVSLGGGNVGSSILVWREDTDQQIFS